MNPIQAVRETIQEELGSRQLPPFLDQVVEMFSQAHLYYRTSKQVRISNKASEDPLGGHPAVYGAALHLVGHYTSIGSYAINVALVTKCTEDLLREYCQLSEDYRALCHAFTWQFPLYEPIEWRRGRTDAQTQLSPSMYLFSQIKIMGFVQQILKINRCMLHVLWQSFKLSMCICDAHLLLNGDQQARYEACTELVAEWHNYKKQLKEDKKRLLEEIEKGSTLIDRILQRMGTTENSTTILKNLKQKMGVLANVSESLIDHLYEVGEDTLDSVFAKGKITPLHINLAAKKAPLDLPQGRFPPWGGQEVETIDTPDAENSILDLIDLPFGDSLKGLSWLASHIMKSVQISVFK
jgi:hypothetical protein